MRLILLLVTLLPAIVIAQQSPSLGSLRDRNRVLLVFAPSDESANFQQQIALLRPHCAEMNDRDLIIIPVLVHVGRPTGPDTLREAFPPAASDQQQIDLRHRFNVPSAEFTVILVGKDGGEKLRKYDPISMQRLISVIDAMPMRKDEMRKARPCP